MSTVEQELAAAQLRVVIDALPDAVVVHRDGQFVFANSACARMLGYDSPLDLLGRSVLTVVHPDDRAAVTTRMEVMLRTGQPVPVLEERMLGRDGQVLVCLIRAMPVRWDGHPGVMVIAQNVTELRRYEERLAMADRLASVGTLAAGMAHDLNNPLASLVLGVDLARELVGGSGAIDGPRADRIRERLAGVSAAAGRLKAIVNDLRVFARQPEEVERLVDVRAPLGDALDLARNELRHRCRVEESHMELPPVPASEGRLVQVFLNLLMNAVQAFPAGRSPELNQLRIETDVTAEGVRVRVTDNGVGIPADEVHHVFEPYFTTKPAGQGTGLGLWMVHGVVRRLGGRVGLTSEEGVGTTVEVVLPLGEVAPTASPPPRPARHEHRRVLVVDDETEIGELLADVLRPAHQVEVHTRGRPALEAILSDPPDLVICDLMMPDFGGRALYEALVADGRGLEARVVFATGGAFTPDASEFLDRVSAPVLHKPFRLADVRKLVDAWLFTAPSRS